jgi:hypothetical protein
VAECRKTGVQPGSRPPTAARGPLCANAHSPGHDVEPRGQDARRLAIQVDRPGHAIAPTLWGIFFEDINLSADGGIYPELVRNRSFEDSEKTENWSLVTSDSAGGRRPAA